MLLRMEHTEFTATERAILAIVQKNLPESTTPYADIAREVGTDEESVLRLLRTLKNDGTIRRFGASIKHQRAGYGHNAMVAWRATEAEAETWGPVLAKNTSISHCYFRPNDGYDWPYTLYTMVHGKSGEECQKAIAEIRQTTGLADFAVLESLKELKKISMTYF